MSNKTVIIPEKMNTLTKTKDTIDKKQELWHIIEKQRTIIQELQKALYEITKERDELLDKLHQEITIPTPPPRSPYRSNAVDTNDTRIELPPLDKQLQRKSMSDLFVQRDETLKPKKYKDGYLTKREKYSGWTRYYFVLEGYQFKYFQLPNLAINNCLQLTHETQIGTRKSQQKQENAFQHAFVIMNKNQAPIILCADSDNERDQWVKILLSRIASLSQATSLKHHRSMPNTTESFSIQHGLFQLFGVSLEDALNVSCKNQLPSIVYRCLAYLEAKDAIYEEGIYRVSGSSVQINQLRQQFCEFGNVDLLLNCDIIDIHVVACLLKMWLRELLYPIISQDFIIQLQEQADSKQPIGPLLSHLLPKANYHLLFTLIDHLRLIVEYSDFNKMTLRNIAIVFAPTLSIPSGLFNLLMTDYESIFQLQVEPTTSADRFKQSYLKRKKNKN